MVDIEWCKKKGLRLIEPNSNLAEEYYRNAEETLKVTNLIKDSGSNMWLATQKYYTEYLAAYAILMRIGIKTEIHSCTIKIIELLQEKDIIDFNYTEILEEDKELRIDNQYYLKNRPVDFDSNKLAQLLLKIRHILDTITEEKIDEIRNLI
ncbi:hypothetical protein GQ472_02125 [archaeon]|nr:hypothetical protein [archaeon]